VRSSHLLFKMHQVSYVRSSLLILMYIGSIAIPFLFCWDFSEYIKVSFKRYSLVCIIRLHVIFLIFLLPGCNTVQFLTYSLLRFIGGHLITDS